jgi:AmmeMemoRadiSam system protein B/AmmeMemoRadiSam system protein A
MMRKSLYLLITCALTAITSAGATAVVRQPAVAGQFYPADQERLTAMVREHLDNVGKLPDINGELMALIVPHAGLVYSGQIAACGYKLLEGADISRVILVGPSHRYRFEGFSVYGPGIEWRTPLGNVACHDSLCNSLLQHDKHFRVVEQAHAQEHCLEVQLPYLQAVLPECEIVPVLMGYPDKAAIRLLTDGLAAAANDRQTLMIASTDWQHYRPASEGWPMDSLGMACLESLDPDRLEKYLNNGRVEMCGGSVTVAVLKAAMAKGANRVKILRYGDSGDISGDKNAVVSYVAAAVYKASGNNPAPTKEKADNTADKPPYRLTDGEKLRLLEIARESIRSYLTVGSVPQFEVPNKLKEPGAAFVTLERQGQLRGCIGHTVAVEPLYKTVSTCAVQAAVADPRFPAVRPHELAGLDIEISVLTPLQEVTSLDQIEVGRDGLMISLGGQRGLLLPQVATDYSWNRTQFLEHTCNKAGLPKDAYKSPKATIYKFQALVFGETELH